MSLPKSQSILSAASSGQYDIVQQLVSNNQNCIYEQGGFGYRAIHYASYGRHLEIVKLILQHDPMQIFCTNDHGNTPLHEASYNGFMDSGYTMIDYLLRQEPSLLYKQNNNGDTPLHLACGNDRLECVQYFVQCDPTLLQMKNQNGYTTLDAAKMPNYRRSRIISFLEIVEYYIHQEKPQKMPSTKLKSCKHGQVIGTVTNRIANNTTNNNNNNKNFISSSSSSQSKKHTNGHLQVVKRILKVYTHNNDKIKTPFQLVRSTKCKYSYHFSHPDNEYIVVPLYPYRLRYKNRQGMTPLMIVTYNGYLNLVRLIIQQDIKCLQDKDNRGRSPFFIACRKGYLEIVWLMIRTDPVGCLNSL